MLGKLIYALAVGCFIAAMAGCGGSVGNITVTSTGSGSATNTPNQPVTAESPTTTTTPAG